MEPPVGRTPGLSQRVTVDTPENVVLEFELAGLGSRSAAALIDTLITIGLLMVLFFGLMRFLPPTGTWLFAVLAIVLFLVMWGYFLLFEAIGGGRTPGKRLMGIRVVMETGHPVTFAAAASRNLLRIIDAQPGLSYGIGGTFVFFDSRHRRIGDLVAGTIVVRDRPDQHRLGVAVAEATPEVQLTATAVLSDAEFRLLEQYLARRDRLAPEARQRIGTDLVSRFAPRFSLRPSGDIPFLRWAYEQELAQRRSRVAVRRSSAPAARAASSADRFVAAKQESWDAFRATAARNTERGLARLPGSAILDFATAYREVAADLARARTYQAEPRVLGYLERLVSSGHNLLYGLRGVRRVPLRELLLGDIPGAVVRARTYVLIAFLAFMVPGVVGYALLRERPDVAEAVLPDEMLARAQAGLTAQEEGVGYAEAPAVLLPLMASRIVTNNVQVAFGAFAFGAAAGLGTLALLAFNGLFFGAVLGHYTNVGVATWLLTFVAPHGVLELPAIFIAGGAGLLLGQAIVAPGDLSRRAALTRNARLAIRLVAASACLLVVAGIIEGFQSASDAPVSLKLATCAAAVVLLVLYLQAGAAHLRRHPAPGHADGTPPLA